MAVVVSPTVPSSTVARPPRPSIAALVLDVVVAQLLVLGVLLVFDGLDDGELLLLPHQLPVADLDLLLQLVHLVLKVTG